MKKASLFFAFMFMSLSFAFAQKTKSVEPAEVQIKTSAVCGMCKSKIERDLSYEKGVISSNLEVQTQIVTVKYNPKKTNPEKIRKAISKTGYDADGVPANPKAYEKLDACCKKDKGVH
jgi:copper chaperone CopZ